MIDVAGISAAFAAREKPALVVFDGKGDSLEMDARHFQDLFWEKVAVTDWRDHSDAIFGMNADAFCYFLPSIMSLSLNGLSGAALAGDSLVNLLDTSSDPDLWDAFFAERFQQLVPAELEALQKWVSAIAGDIANSVALQRMHDTVQMLLLLKG